MEAVDVAIDIPVRDHGRRLRAILSDDARLVTQWLDGQERHAWLACVVIIALGCGLYGGALGFWHAERQALYAAIKLPCLILLTTAGNAVLNGMLAQLLGTGLSFRQTS